MIEQNKKWNLHNPLLYALVIGIGMFLGYKMKGTLLHADAIGTSNGNIDEIMNLVKERYVDSVGTDSVEAKAIDNLLSQLDPHSVYIPPSDLKSVDEDMDGEFEGIGIEYFVKKDTLMVTSVIAGGPSAEAGILTGDKFIAVNDSVIAGKKLSTEVLVKNLRGRSGTIANIKLIRNNKLISNIAIKRGKIPMYSVDASYMMTTTVGYIKINRFAATTYDEFMKAMKKLQQAGMKKLMIDVRDNPGGYLETAVQIIDEMIPGKKKIVYTRGRTKANETFSASKTGLFETGKVVVLVDEGSASAAEIVSGALQDYDRATIIGRRTFGKGLVQEQYPLSNGGALRLTVARYYIPSGRCIQKDYSNGIENYQEDVMNRFKKGEFVSQDSVTFKDTTVYKTMAGRRVYGGGGIMPDVFVPLVNNKYSEQLSDIISSGNIAEIANNYFVNNKEALAKYTTPSDLNKYANALATMLQQLQQKCKTDRISTTNFANAADKKLISIRLMAQLAKAKFGNAAQYEVFNADDDMVKVALREMEK
jgi:carboxyl-terminal processing protease